MSFPIPWDLGNKNCKEFSCPANDEDQKMKDFRSRKHAQIGDAQRCILKTHPPLFHRMTSDNDGESEVARRKWTTGEEDSSSADTSSTKKVIS